MRNRISVLLLLAAISFHAAAAAMNVGIGANACILTTDFSGAGMMDTIGIAAEATAFPHDDPWTLVFRADVSIADFDRLRNRGGSVWEPSGNLDAMIRCTPHPGFSIAFGGGVSFEGGKRNLAYPEAAIEPSFTLGRRNGFSSSGIVRIGFPIRLAMQDGRFRLEACASVICYLF